jgi:SAM-dependent methyltransferase
VALNNEFYQTFAENFSATRMRLQPGVMIILEDLPEEADILDLGCGNGELASALASRGQRGRYLGMDFSPELLKIARQKLESFPQFAFIQGNLAAPDWDVKVARTAENRISKPTFDMVTAFATLHHLPGDELRRRNLRKVHELIHPEGCFIHSNWQFLNSKRLRERIQSWSEIGLTPESVDPGDYLLDWRRGGRGLRYVHHFSESELEVLAGETGFCVLESFYSDGKGGDLSLYQVWGKDPQAA